MNRFRETPGSNDKDREKRDTRGASLESSDPGTLFTFEIMDVDYKPSGKKSAQKANLGVLRSYGTVRHLGEETSLEGRKRIPLTLGFACGLLSM